MSGELTLEQVRALLDESTPGEWKRLGTPTIWADLESGRRLAVAQNLTTNLATGDLLALAPDLARAYLAQSAQLAACRAQAEAVARLRDGLARYDTALEAVATIEKSLTPEQQEYLPFIGGGQAHEDASPSHPRSPAMSGGLLEPTAAEYDVLEVADHYVMLARMVHRSWRDGMLEQGREVASHRMAWESLGFQDQSLDVFIGREVAREAFRLLGSLTALEQPVLACRVLEMEATIAAQSAQLAASARQAEAVAGVRQDLYGVVVGYAGYLSFMDKPVAEAVKGMLEELKDPLARLDAALAQASAEPDAGQGAG